MIIGATQLLSQHKQAEARAFCQTVNEHDSAKACLTSSNQQTQKKRGTLQIGIRNVLN
jgi:hypothetical protein